MVNRATEEIDQTILKAGEQATFDAGVSGLDSELIRLLGNSNTATVTEKTY